MMRINTGPFRRFAIFNWLVILYMGASVCICLVALFVVFGVCNTQDVDAKQANPNKHAITYEEYVSRCEKLCGDSIYEVKFTLKPECICELSNGMTCIPTLPIEYYNE